LFIKRRQQGEKAFFLHQKLEIKLSEPVFRLIRVTHRFHINSKLAELNFSENPSIAMFSEKQKLIKIIINSFFRANLMRFII